MKRFVIDTLRLLKKRLNLISMSKKASRRNLYEFLSDEVSKINDDSRILNVGAGGEIAATLKMASSQTNISLFSIDISSEREPDIVGDICEICFENEFDAIVIAEVLEHVQRPLLACQKIYDALQPGGRLIMTTPFIFPLHDRPHDYWRFTRYGLEYLLKATGFTEINIKERNGWGESITVLMWRVVNTPGHPRLSRYCAAILAMMFSPVGKCLSYKWPHDFLTTGYVVTAVKKDRK